MANEIKAKMGRPPLELPMLEILKLSEHHTLRHIGEMFGVAHTTIGRRLQKLREKARKRKDLRETVYVHNSPTYTMYVFVGKRVQTVHK